MRRLIEVLAVGVTDDSGNPVENGTATFYDAGTSSLRTVYQDFAETSTLAHANPATLDAAGRLIAYSSYRVKLVIRASTGAIVRTIDNVGTADSDLSSASASTFAGSGLIAPGDGSLAVNVDGNTIEINSDTLRVKDAGISRNKFDATTTLAPNELHNISVSCSVASSALTILLNSNAGTDFSTTDYGTIAFRSTTLTSGVASRVTITAAVTDIVISSGSTLGHVSAAEWPIYVYALNNAGTVELAVSSSPVDERYRQSTTVLAGGGNDDSVSALYSTTARANVAVRLIAVLKSTQATAGTWAAVPTHVSNPTSGNLMANLVSRPSHTTVGVGGIAVSSSSSTFTSTSTTPTDVTNLSVTLTTGGRPVKIEFVADGDSGGSYVGVSGTNAVYAMFTILRGATGISYNLVNSTNTTTDFYLPPSILNHTDLPAAGTYTYKIQVSTSDGTDTISVRRVKMVAYEL